MTRRQRTWVAWLIAIVGALLIVGIVAGTATVAGRHAAVTALSVGMLLVIPGDLARRALFPRWVTAWPAVAALAVAGSFALLVAIGLPLALLGRFGVIEMQVAVVVVSLATAAVAQLRGGLLRRPAQSVLALLAAIGLAAAGLLLFEHDPAAPDRIALGQLDTAVQIAMAGDIPSATRSFGEVVAFPTHYLFYDMIVGTLVLLGGQSRGADYLQLLAALRLPAIGLFAIGFFLAGQAFVRVTFGERRQLDRYLVGLAALALPALLFFNAVVQGKLREALTEGISLGLIAVALWASIRLTDGHGRRRRRWAAIAGVTLGLVAGTHLPGAVGAAMLAGTWLVLGFAEDVAASARRTEKLSAWRRTSRWRPAVRASMSTYWPAFLIPVSALLVYDLAGGGTLLRLIGGALSQGRANPESAYRALLLMAAAPLSTLTPAEYTAQYINPELMFVAPRYAATAVVLLATGGVAFSFFLKRSVIRPLIWLAVAAAATVSWVYAGPLLGADTIAPWNTIMRNAYYAWLPLGFLALAGIAGLPLALSAAANAHARSARLARWVRSGASLAAVVILIMLPIVPVAQEQVRDIRRYGWLVPGQMTPAGFDALRWLSIHTPSDARILAPEITYGSQLIADREMVTEGKGTLESAEVTDAAIAALESAGSFYLASRDPSVLAEYGIDYVMAFGDAPYARAQFGGVPLLRTYVGRATSEPALPLEEEPYLSLVYESGQIRIFAVDRERLPTVQADRVSEPTQAPPCTADRCYTYYPESDACPDDGWTIQPGECVIVRLGGGLEGKPGE